MATYIGKCPYCEDGIIEYESKQVRGKKTKVYCCSNNKVTTVDEGETWEPTADSTCSWKLFGSSLERWGKKFIGPKEVKKLLAGDEVIAHMYSYVKKVEYKKYLTISEEYGVSVLWEMDVQEEEEDETKEKKSYKKAYQKNKTIEIEENEKIEHTRIVKPINKKPSKKIFPKSQTSNKKDIDSIFSKEDMESLVLPNDAISILPKKSITKEQNKQEKTEQEFVKRTFVKPVFVNKKSTDEGAAF